MARPAPRALRHGSLTVYLASLHGCADLASIADGLPSNLPLVWLDSARHHPVTGRWSLLAFDPWLTCVMRGDRVQVRTSASTRAWRAHPLEALRQVLKRYRASSVPSAYARAVGLVGWLSYDLNRWIERLPPPQPEEPAIPDMAWWGMRQSILVDHLEERTWLISTADPHAPSAWARRQALESLDALEARVRAPRRQPCAAAAVPCGAGSAIPRATSTQAEFEQMVSRVLKHIRAGDLFQANVAQRFTIPWQGSALPLYHALRAVNPSPFACFVSCEDLQVVSCSPERLVRVQEGRIDTRPIAGTRPRGMTPTEDALNEFELLLSEKERAEHIMLVDLARNDLGRVCRMGSVSADELMMLETYSHVIHIVSDVAGALRLGVDAVDVIRAVFPGGTITGCPKVRCMEILRELEPVARGLYTGSLGYIGFDGTMDLNIAIRTMIIQGSRLSFHVGAGIVADSVPEREYHETLAKARALTVALEQSAAQDSWWGVEGHARTG